MYRNKFIFLSLPSISLLSPLSFLLLSLLPSLLPLFSLSSPSLLPLPLLPLPLLPLPLLLLPLLPLPLLFLFIPLSASESNRLSFLHSGVVDTAIEALCSPAATVQYNALGVLRLASTKQGASISFTSLCVLEYVCVHYNMHK